MNYFEKDGNFIVLCPSMEGVDLKGKYNDVDRNSFSIQILTCNKITYSGICKTDDEIGRLLKSVYFNLYTISQDIELGNSQNYGKSPLTVID